MPDMPALTLWPEWAFAVAHLGKNAENRSPRFAQQIARRVGDGWLAIHAGVKRPADFTAVGAMLDEFDPCDGWTVHRNDGEPAVFRVWVGRSHNPLTITDADLPRGAIVALVKLGDVLPPGVEAPWKVPESAALPFTRVHVLPEPIPCRGAQGLWTPPPDVQERLRAAYAGVSDGDDWLALDSHVNLARGEDLAAVLAVARDKVVASVAAVARAVGADLVTAALAAKE